MDLAEQTIKAENNHREAVSDFKESMQDLHPANVAPALALQGIAQDTQISYLTLQTLMRISDEGFTDSE